MSKWVLFKALSLASCLAAGAFLNATASEAASPGQLTIKRDGSATDVVKIGHRRYHRGYHPRGTKIFLPLGPAYIYYDYPYYYSRGYYPTHIGGYVYYPAVASRRTYYPIESRRCSKGNHKCAAERISRREPHSNRRRSR